MRVRDAVILPLGMLNQSVNTDVFIGELLGEAKHQHADFVFTKELRAQCFAVSERFNRDEIAPDLFRQQILGLLNVAMAEQIFWEHWNKIVTVGPIQQLLSDLNFFSMTKEALIYLHSDTNVKHLEKLQSDYQQQGIQLDTRKKPALLQTFPLYTSCAYRANRMGLLEAIYQAIHDKNFSIPERTYLVLGDPNNIQNAEHRAMEQSKLAIVQEWCKNNKVQLILHDKNRPLMDTLNEHIHYKIKYSALPHHSLR